MTVAHVPLLPPLGLPVSPQHKEGPSSLEWQASRPTPSARESHRGSDVTRGSKLALFGARVIHVEEFLQAVVTRRIQCDLEPLTWRKRLDFCWHRGR